METELDELRRLFLQYLTVDSITTDMRRKDFNQAIFNAEEGWQVFAVTDLTMVMNKFDEAVRTLKAKEKK